MLCLIWLYKCWIWMWVVGIVRSINMWILKWWRIGWGRYWGVCYIFIVMIFLLYIVIWNVIIYLWMVIKGKWRLGIWGLWWFFVRYMLYIVLLVSVMVYSYCIVCVFGLWEGEDDLFCIESMFYVKFLYWVC